jgi:DNA-binding NarL/FixJ family response regulator
VPSPEAAERRRRAGLSSTQRRVLAALCRPYKGKSGFAAPASDEQIAEELFLSVGEVRGHVRVLHAKLGFTAQPTPETRVRLVEHAFSQGLITESDL